MHPTVAAFASPFLPFIRHAKSAPSCKAKTLANAQVFRPSTAEIYPLNSTKILFYFLSVRTLFAAVGTECGRYGNEGNKHMDDTVQLFLNTHRTTAHWLHDIIDAFISRRGTAHVKVIADDLVKSNKTRDKDTVEEIVTRRINDFLFRCSRLQQGCGSQSFRAG